MFCPYCGYDNQTESRFCTHCGAPISPENPSPQNAPQHPYPMNPYTPPQQGPYPPVYGYSYPPIAPPPPSRENSASAIAGFVLSLVSIFLPWIGLVTSLIGVILSGVGISHCNKYNQDGKGMGIAGVIISSFVLFFYVLVILLFVLAANSIIS